MARRRKKKFFKKPEEYIIAAAIALGLLEFILDMIGEMFRAIGRYLASITVWEWLLTAAVTGLLAYAGFMIYRWRSKAKSKRARMENLYRIRRGANINKLRAMDPYTFEQYVAEVFRGLGYVCQVTPKSGDGGKDIIMKKDGKTYLAECKRYNTTKVGRPEIQKLHSSIIDTNAVGGFFVTTSSFSLTAVNYARGKGIELIDENELMDLIDEATRLGTRELG